MSVCLFTILSSIFVGTLKLGVRSKMKEREYKTLRERGVRVELLDTYIQPHACGYSIIEF